ncbi:sperm microtubule associated protein 2-like [Rhynchonycteris naso]
MVVSVPRVARASRAPMKNQEFSGSLELFDEHVTTEISTHLKILPEPIVHRIPSVHDEPAELEELGEPEVSEADQQGQPDMCSEPCEPYEPHDPHLLSEIHKHCEPHELQAPREPRKLCLFHKLQGPQAPYKPSKHHKHHKHHEAELHPGVVMVSPSLVTRLPCSPRSSLSDPVPSQFARKWIMTKRCELAFVSSFSRRRIQDLSKPKKQWRAPDRKLLWGNQDPIHPVCRNALKAQLTKRLENLAQPKEVSYRYVPNRSQYYYNCGTESIIWDIASPVVLRRPSKRIQKLAQPNRFKMEHLINRSFSDYLTRESVQISDPSPRILRLSIAKGINPNYVPPKCIQTKISSSALNAVASPRIIDLAHPRIKIEGLCYPRENTEVPVHPISHAALLVQPSPRIIALAKAKPFHQDYVPNRNPYWPVSHAALHSKISSRIEELANPNARTPMHIVYYDPEVFKVKPAALKSQCSQRIQELAEPLRH